MSRPRSFWGWGYEDKFPSDDVRKSLAARLGSVFGTEPKLRPLPTLEQAKVPEPRFQPPVELKSFGTTDVRERATHTYGRGYRDLVRGFAGDFSAAPDWVFYPTDEAQLVLLFRFCESEGIALIPYGGGTSVVGGVEYHAEGRHRGKACVDLSRMDKVLEVDPATRAARIQAGASGPRISQQLSAHGLTLRHYPQSYELSTLGGWIATRAGGHFATLYTHIDDLVESVRAVTPSGVWASRRLPGSGAGPSPDRLLLGSEGTLGVITEAWVRVQAKPVHRASVTVRFPSFQQGADAVRAISQSGLYPANCRLIDRREARMMLAGDGGADLLVLGFESADHEVGAWLERALELCGGCGGSWDERRRSGREGAA